MLDRDGWAPWTPPVAGPARRPVGARTLRTGPRRRGSFQGRMGGQLAMVVDGRLVSTPRMIATAAAARETDPTNTLLMSGRPSSLVDRRPTVGCDVLPGVAYLNPAFGDHSEGDGAAFVPCGRCRARRLEVFVDVEEVTDLLQSVAG